MLKKLLLLGLIFLPVSVQAKVIDIPVKCQYVESRDSVMKNYHFSKMNGVCKKYSLNSNLNIDSSINSEYYAYIYEYRYKHHNSRGDLYIWFGDTEQQITYKDKQINFMKITKTDKPIRYKQSDFFQFPRAMDFTSQYFNYLSIPPKLENKPFIFTSHFFKKSNTTYGLVIQNFVGKNRDFQKTYSELSPEQMDSFSEGNTLKIGDNYLIPSNAPGLIDSMDKYIVQQNELNDKATDDDKAYIIKDVSIMNNIFDKLTQ